jgi:hypothetical protein
LFSGNGVRLIVPEELLDRDLKDVTGEELAAELSLRSEKMLSCPSCGRVHLVGQT